MIKSILTALIAVLVLAPAVANASPQQVSIFEDDAQLLQRGPAVEHDSLQEMDTLGADVIRSLALWGSVAPHPKSKKRPKRFDATDPSAYPAALWDRYDDLVRGATARGINVLLSPSGPVPRWGSQCKGSANSVRSCNPKATEFGKFVEALGTRYSGSYPDENQGQGVLPRVAVWSIWNEPNQPGWLAPQYALKHGRKIPVAADIYRKLAYAAIRGLRRSGHGSDTILLGETAPIGRTSGTLARRPIPPVDFIRELLCLDRSGRRLKGSLARIAGCNGAPKFGVNGFAHHPYTRGGSQPPLARTLPGEITISTASRLKRLLAQGVKAHMVPPSLPIWYTEFGYQTNPPDRLFGVGLDEQAAFINQSDWIAYQDKRVRSVAQYLLVDEANVANFQTGLRFLKGTPKPAYDAYRVPIWVVRAGSGVRVYGQVRPAVDDAHEVVQIQHQADGGGGFTTVQTVEISSHKGQFLQDVAGTGGTWRLKWSPSTGGPPLYSRTATAEAK